MYVNVLRRFCLEMQSKTFSINKMKENRKGKMFGIAGVPSGCHNAYISWLTLNWWYQESL